MDNQWGTPGGTYIPEWGADTSRGWSRDTRPTKSSKSGWEDDDTPRRDGTHRDRGSNRDDRDYTRHSAQRWTDRREQPQGYSQSGPP